MNKVKEWLKYNYKYPVFIIASLTSFAYYSDGLDFLSREVNIYISGMIGMIAISFGFLIIYSFIFFIIHVSRTKPADNADKQG